MQRETDSRQTTQNQKLSICFHGVHLEEACRTLACSIGMLSRRRIPVIPWMVPIVAFAVEVGWLCRC
jgi:hypothetical protein